MKFTAAQIKAHVRQDLFNLNFLCVPGGILALLFSDVAVIGNIFGILWIVATAANFIDCGRMDGRKDSSGAPFLLVGAFALFLLPVLNTMTSTIGPSAVLFRILSILVVFGLPAWRIVRKILALRKRETSAAAEGSRESGSEKAKLRRIVPLAVLAIATIGGLAFGIQNAFVRDPGILGVLGAQYSPLWGFSFLALAVLGFRIAVRRIARVAYLAAGLSVFVLCLLPLAAIPFVIAKAESDFTASFGRSASSVEMRSDPVAPAWYRTSPFNFAEYLFGGPGPATREIRDVRYYEGQLPYEQDLALSFDAYLPPDDGSARPVLIRVHGGAWVSGDKGYGNMPQVNRHFAAQGYAVFDVQYGLNDEGRFALRAPTPENVIGPYSIDDMVRHIGIFSRYLADHAAEYGVDLDRVFLSGGSAGGHLILAIALSSLSSFGADHPELTLDPRLHVRGLIPFYPANGIAHDIGIAGDDDLVDPVRLLASDSPPMLIYQGLNDGMVAPEIAARFVDEYRSLRGGDAPILEIAFPFAGHGSDYYFSVPFNQVFVYYMERFMRLFE